MLQIIIAIICIGLLIFIHELGHFFAARAFGVAVYRFAIGFPPKVISFTRKGIVYALNLIPLGGYVSIKGFGADDEANANATAAGTSYQQVSVIKKMVIVLAGIAANVVFAYLVFVFLFAKGIAMPIDSIDSTLAPYSQNPYVQVSSVMKNNPAEIAGLHFGDRVKSIVDMQGNRVSQNTQAVFDAFQRVQTTGLVFTLQSDGTEKSVTIIPELQNDGTYKAGLMLETYATIRVPIMKSLWFALQTTESIIRDTFAGVGQLFEKLFTQKQSNINVSGPVGIIQTTGQQVSYGWQYLLSFLAILSINLAVLNILPLPPLDGWHALKAIYKSVFRRDLPHLIETIISVIGIVLVLALITYATVGDVRALF